MAKVAIVGGGIAGLTAAHVLRKREIPFVLLEAAPAFGGVIRSEASNGFAWEAGPDAILAQKVEGLALCRELGLGDGLVPTNPETKTVYILRRGRLFPLPEGMMLAVPTRIVPFLTSGLFSWKGKLRMGLDLLIPARKEEKDESIASFLRRRFGQECVDLLGEPLLAGIHSGDPEQLSMRATFVRFVEMERRSGSLIKALMFSPRPKGKPGAAFYSLKGGLKSLADALVSRLPSGSLRPNERVLSIERNGDGGFRVVAEGGATLGAEAAIVAAPAPHAAAIVRGVDPLLAEALGAIRFVSAATVVLGFRREHVSHPLDGYGLLVPRTEGLRTNAVSFVSTKFPGRAPEGHVLIRGFFGGARDEAALEMDDAELVQVLRREMSPVLGLHGDPVVARVHRWPKSTPQMEVGHLDRVLAIDDRVVRTPGLYLAGAGLRVTGIPDVVADATTVAGKVADFIQGRRGPGGKP